MTQYRTPEAKVLASLRPRVEAGEKPTETNVLVYEMQAAQGHLQIYAEVAEELKLQNARLRAALCDVIAADDLETAVSAARRGLYPRRT